MRTNDWFIIAAGVIVVLAVTTVTGILVALSATTPAVIAASLTAFAGVLATIPRIIKALHGHEPCE
jgi:hypothetical protein